MWGRMAAINPLSIRHPQKTNRTLSPLHANRGLALGTGRKFFVCAWPPDQRRIRGMNGNRFGWVVESVSQVLLYIHYLCLMWKARCCPICICRYPPKYASGRGTAAFKSPWIGQFIDLWRLCYAQDLKWLITVITLRSLVLFVGHCYWLQCVAGQHVPLSKWEQIDSGPKWLCGSDHCCNL